MLENQRGETFCRKTMLDFLNIGKMHSDTMTYNYSLKDCWTRMNSHRIAFFALIIDRNDTDLSRKRNPGSKYV